ncbi:winged helix DNA-binding protein [Streptomyces cellulosae]|uniref:Winged helix DNA-binding protein n=1 Tax=Streptomyces cellulosae TaxID=1968 RepID=A0ABW7Y7I0_STRCE
MAEPQSNARLRADAGAPTSGVIHVRTRLTADFTVLANALVQRRGSAVTIGVAAYIASLPTGTPVTIAALCEHFDEGEILISRALRELEEAGYLERRRERTPSGQIRTRTYFYDVPGGDPDDGPPIPPKPPRPRKRPAAEKATPASATTTEAAPASTPDHPQKPASLSDVDPQAVAVLTSLRRVDPRLVLSEREAVRLAPAVAQWLAAGVAPTQVTALLTARLPDTFLTRPAGILAFRLRETPLPAPPPLTAPPITERPAVLPFQTCDGCERAFRAPEPGRCRDCRRPEACLPIAA